MDRKCLRTSSIELENNSDNDDTNFTTTKCNNMRPTAHFIHPWICRRCLCGAVATPFYRFLARFSGRRRTQEDSSSAKLLLVHSPVWIWLLILTSFISTAETCSSRATPKPRPPAPTPRPNITFHTYKCPQAYDAWYCLNGATCFSVIIGDSTLYNCVCADGFMGPRCEFKDLDGSYLPSQHRIQLETASIAGGATIAIFLVFILCMAAYIRIQRRSKARMVATTTNESLSFDCVDGTEARVIRNSIVIPKRIFGHHSYPLKEHLQRSINTLALPMENVTTSDNNQKNEQPEIIAWLEPSMKTVRSGRDDRSSSRITLSQQTRVV